MVPFVVRGKSMEPSLREGDLVLARRAREPLAKGDVIVYRHPRHGFYVVHRVADAARGLVWTAGDCNADVDGQALSAGSIVGKVWLVLPWLGQLVRLLRRIPWP